MVQNYWTTLPFPFSELAEPIPLPGFETPCILAHWKMPRASPA